jgi:hypothetical protein
MIGSKSALGQAAKKDKNYAAGIKTFRLDVDGSIYQLGAFESEEDKSQNSEEMEGGTSSLFRGLG